MKLAKRILSFLLMLLVAISASVLHVSAISADTDEVFSGIDVSVYQGDIDFEQVKSSGIEVVYIRAGYGFSVTDPKFEENYTNATKAGLKCGAYYFVTARNTEQAYLQATRFAELISGKTFAARPAMDFEEFGSLGKNGINIVGLAFMQKLRELTGIVPILYTDAYNASETWDWNFAQFPLWVADYDAEEPYVTSNIWQSYAGFQYSDRPRQVYFVGIFKRRKRSYAHKVARCHKIYGKTRRHALGDCKEIRRYGVSCRKRKQYQKSQSYIRRRSVYNPPYDVRGKLRIHALHGKTRRYSLGNIEKIRHKHKQHSRA